MTESGSNIEKEEVHISEINGEKIMEEIREEVRKKGEQEYVPGMDEMPVSALRKFDWTVSSAYPVTEGNPLKRIYTKIVSKIVRCALFPMGNRLTQIHEQMAMRMDEMMSMIEDQQQEINDLYLRIEEMEKK